MFFDEDGDLAHEFYEEVIDKGHSRMKRQVRNLRPQVYYISFMNHYLFKSFTGIFKRFFYNQWRKCYM
jgi:hypothetical protein